MSAIESIEAWFKAAKPAPVERDFWIQAGCDAEEVAEGLESLGQLHTSRFVSSAADNMKGCPDGHSIDNVDGLALLDAICDRIVTSIGMAYMLGMDVHGALEEVQRSNWSKFVDGKPVFDENGKIAKGPDYTPPDLTPFVGSPLWEAVR